MQREGARRACTAAGCELHGVLCMYAACKSRHCTHHAAALQVQQATADGQPQRRCDMLLFTQGNRAACSGCQELQNQQWAAHYPACHLTLRGRGGGWGCR
jgi:hypothetical protein